MAQYQSKYTGTQIDEAIAKSLAARDEIYIGDGEMPNGATIQLIMDGVDEEQALKDDLKDYINDTLEMLKGEIATLTAEMLRNGGVVGYIDENNNIVISGNLPNGSYIIQYDNGEGVYEEIGGLVINEKPEIDDNNLAQPDSADWLEGYRLSVSDGGASELAGHVTTNFIPCKAGDVLTVTGLNILGQISDSGVGGQKDAKIVAYDANKSLLFGGYGGTSDTDTSKNFYYNKVSVKGDTSTFTIFNENTKGQIATADVAYIRIDGAYLSGYSKYDVSITVSEGPGEVTPDNLLPKSTDASGNPYVGLNGEKGYKDGYKISVTSGNEAPSAGYKVTGFIPVTLGQKITFKGISFETSGTNTNFAFYNSSKTRQGGGNWYLVFPGGVNGEEVSVVFNDASMKPTMGNIDSTTAFIRISASVMDENSTITVTSN